jgi:hypothetical protein
MLATFSPAGAELVQPTRASVDLIELNHFLDENGRQVFRQVIFYDWSAERKQFQVRAWRLVKQPSQLPKRSWEPEGYLVRWSDKAEIREVFAKTMRETWSQQDPERTNRKLLPEDQRQPLFPPREASSR